MHTSKHARKPAPGSEGIHSKTDGSSLTTPTCTTAPLPIPLPIPAKTKASMQQIRRNSWRRLCCVND